jgi:hypothetical protein
VLVLSFDAAASGNVPTSQSAFWFQSKLYLPGGAIRIPTNPDAKFCDAPVEESIDGAHLTMILLAYNWILTWEDQVATWHNLFINHMVLSSATGLVLQEELTRRKLL